MDKFFFPLRNEYYYGRQLNKILRTVLGDKLVQNAHATGLLAQTVGNAGDGHYVEIGSLHGGSAITAALVKKEFKLAGNIYCIEPHPGKIKENAKLFKVDSMINVTVLNSDQVDFSDMEYTCGFIDGDHRGPNPRNDFTRLNQSVTKYMIFDDYDKSERGVVSAVATVMESFYAWRLAHCSDAIVIFVRRYDESSSSNTR